MKHLLVCLATLGFWVGLGLPADAAQGGKKGAQYAFLVGCSHYLKTEFRTLPYTGNDVNSFRDALLATAFEADHIVALHDGQKEMRYRPLRANILRELDLLLDGMRPEDSVVVALSGHGIQFKGDPISYFVPVDGKVTDKKTLLPLNGPDGLFAQLKTCKAKRKLVIVNACRHQPTVNQEVGGKKLELVDEDREGEVPEGIAALYSCKAGQKSYSDPERKRSLFFDHVSRAWQGEYKKSGRVTLAALLEQVTVRTKTDVNKSLGGKQVPVLRNSFQGEWEIARSLGKIREEIQAEVVEYMRPASVGDTKRANQWLKSAVTSRLPAWQEAADRGSVEAMWLLGICLDEGIGLSKDEAKAVQWYRKAANRGYATAQCSMGVMYQSGRGVAKDAAEAIKWYRKAADQGFVNAQNNLGVMYEAGRGVAKDDVEAVKWLRKAADQGLAIAQNCLGALYATGRYVTKDEVAAVRWYRKAADQGDAGAQFNLAEMYVNGHGVAKDDVEAVKWYRKAADQGLAIAQNFLGAMYEVGRGVARDEAEAVKWYRKAAEQGDAYGQGSLGKMYAIGSGVAKDDVESVKWLRKAADQGFAIAQTNLGAMYENGRGVSKSLDQAIYWYRRARDAGEQTAAANLKRLNQ